jgi:hypothetical protein
MTNSTARGFAALSIAALAAASLTSCAGGPGALGLQYDGLSERRAEVCVELAIEAAGWSERRNGLLAVVRDAPSADVGAGFLGSIESSDSDEIFEWVCKVTTNPEDTVMLAELTEMKAS